MQSDVNITYVGAGAATSGNNVSLTPALPTAAIAGDLLLIWTSIRGTTKTVNTPAGWTVLVTLENVTLLARIMITGDVAPTVTFAGGAAGDTTIAQMCAFRGTLTDLTTIVHTYNTVINASSQNIFYPGIIVEDSGCVILYLGWKQDDWTSVANVHDVNMTRAVDTTMAAEIGEPDETAGNDAGMVWDYVIQNVRSTVPYESVMSYARTVASNTFIVTGGGNAVSKGITIALRPSTGSVEFAAALAKGSVTYSQRRVFADWAQNGYGIVGSIDDLSSQLGEPGSIEQSLDDGLPDDVTMVAGVGAATAKFPMVHGRSGLNAAQYFSPYRTDSPVYGYDRDVAPIFCDVGVVTSAGQKFIRAFTGRMVNASISGRDAVIDAVSSTRLKLAALLTPPTVTGYFSGCNVTWPILYALQKCGIHATPPVRSTTRVWAPMCGSLVGMVWDAAVTNTLTLHMKASSTVTTWHEQPTWITGPFTIAPNAYSNASKSAYIFAIGMYCTPSNIGTPAANDVISQRGCAGRLEVWVKGDTVNTTCDVDGDFTTNMTTITLYGGIGSVSLLIDTATRVFYIEWANGSGGSETTAHSVAIPSDGKWHSVGIAWNFASGVCYTYLDGVMETHAKIAMTSAGLAAIDGQLYLSIISVVPVAEIQVSPLSAAPVYDPTTNISSDWFDCYAIWSPAGSNVIWSPDALVRSSDMELSVLSVDEPVEAWEFIAEFAKCELALLRTDEWDRVLYLPPPYWLDDERQVIGETLDTTINVNAKSIVSDPSRIRNAISVNWNSIDLSRAIAQMNEYDPVFDPMPVISLENVSRGIPVTVLLPGIDTFVTVPIDSLTVLINQYVTLFGVLWQVIDESSAPDGTFPYITANTLPNADGSYCTDISQLVPRFVSQSGNTVTVAIMNNTTTSYYLVNNQTWPAVGISGVKLSSTTQTYTNRDTASITSRGERSLTVSANALQRVQDAYALSERVLGSLYLPFAKVDTATILTDPRRQPGDLVIFRDVAGTGVNATFRIQSIKTMFNGANTTQEVSLHSSLGTIAQAGIWVSDVETDPTILAQAGVWDGNTCWSP